MSSAEDQEFFPVQCSAFTAATSGEVARLSALPGHVGAVPPSVRCQLAHGHDDGHAAFIVAADGGDRWWWLCWTAGHRDLVERDPCDEIEQAHGLPEECMLPRQHPGPHSYEITTMDRLGWRRSNG